MFCHVDGAQQKVHTVSRKSERLVNLTIALLATKRWLTKSQIFSSIDGYEGELEAKERMFERDKDDLRNLGITIEVGSFDPLFEDEVGYRIRPESYTAKLESITPREISLISLATQAWKGAVLDSAALSALVKLKSLGIDSDIDSIPAMAPNAPHSDSNFLAIINAIANRHVISFSYLNADFEIQERVLEPYGVGTKSGLWYVAGFDLDRKELRLFRLDRVESEIKQQGKSSAYEIPDSFIMSDLLESPDKDKQAIIQVRRGKGHLLRAKADGIEEGEEWSVVNIPYSDGSQLLGDVLWLGEDAIILEPKDLRDSAIKALKEIVELHG
jgi:proteasome accessory factor B